ncbi:unnamed protein product [Lupinus luteus]|uniref:Uncharacterized protein n=1 Tax=Lupinus luteus TaxID=3873 RepID=A0AAV1XAH9_LUPLU
MLFEEPRFSVNLSSNNYDTRQRGRERGLRGSSCGRSNVQGRFGTYARGRGQKICTYCQKTGHIMDACYKKHGFPQSYSINSSNVNCYLGADPLNDEAKETVQTRFKEEKPDSGSLCTPSQHNALKNLIQESLNQGIHNTNQISSTKISMPTFDHSKSGKPLTILSNIGK